jgi:putative transposase
MMNHAHLLAIPECEDSLSRTLRYVHGRFAQYANAELNRCGHFWQNRFYSCPVDRAAVDPVLAYIERNPARAGLTAEPQSFAWSSAAVHTGIRGDRFGVDMKWWAASEWDAQSWSRYLAVGCMEESDIRLATFTGRPFGSDAFVQDLERRLNRTLQRQKPGPKPTGPNSIAQGGLFGWS